MSHVMPVKIYGGVLGALLVLTLLTVWVATIPMGAPWNDVVALGVAVSKATLVVLFFMHVKYSTRMTTVVILAAILFFIFLFGFTLADYLGRGLVLDANQLPVPGR